ncbi:sensor histidine kinase [Anaerobacillus sp. HL2]|nr:sensor histidine kinase [Anaerobacillus sp. HL2]
MPSKGEIQINITDEPDYLVINIIDNGIEITPDEQEVIFEPGYTTKFDETDKLLLE